MLYIVQISSRNVQAWSRRPEYVEWLATRSGVVSTFTLKFHRQTNRFSFMVADH